MIYKHSPKITRNLFGRDALCHPFHNSSISVLPLFKSLISKLWLSHVVPSDWRKATVKPIPRTSTTDRRYYLYNIVVWLSLTEYKLYAIILSNRLVKYIEDNHTYAEKNGFRQNRSCADHIFTLH